MLALFKKKKKNHYTSVVLQYFLLYSVTDGILCLILDPNEWASSAYEPSESNGWEITVVY